MYVDRSMSGDGCRVLLLVLAATLMSLSDPPALGVSVAYSTARCIVAAAE